MGTITKQLQRTAPAVIQSSNYQAVILYSTFADWTPDDTQVSDEAVARMRRGLNSVGMHVLPIAVTSAIAPALKGLDPRDTVIFNWCEGLNGDPNAYDAVPPLLEELGFAYTGA